MVGTRGATLLRSRPAPRLLMVLKRREPAGRARSPAPEWPCAPRGRAALPADRASLTESPSFYRGLASGHCSRNGCASLGAIPLV